jgi:hypothetical protein
MSTYYSVGDMVHLQAVPVPFYGHILEEEAHGDPSVHDLQPVEYMVVLSAWLY